MTDSYDPASWATNRSQVGLAILGLTWSSAFAGLAAALEGSSSQGSDWGAVFGLLAGLCGLIALIAITVIGCRLAFVFGPVPAQQARPATFPVGTNAAPGTPSVRILGTPDRRSDAKTATLLILGGITAVALVVAVVVTVLG